VNRHGLLEVFLCLFGQRSDADHARVINKDIDSSKVIDDPADEIFGLWPVADVANRTENAVPATFEVYNRSLDLFAVSCTNGNVRAGVAKLPGHDEPEPPGPAGDQNDLTGEINGRPLNEVGGQSRYADRRSQYGTAALPR
jgi:hypothetical protein